MKTIFALQTREELQNRIKTLSPANKAQWGKMNAFQMVKHCSLAEDMYHGRMIIKRVFIGRLIGKMILKKALKEGAPFGKNSPTSPLLITLNQSGDIEAEKKEWLKKIDEYKNFSNFNFVHPFFGPMSKEQIGVFVYKHIDHHLRQFGA